MDFQKEFNYFILQITLSATQNEPHSIKVYAAEYLCIFGVQKFPSLKICLNKFPFTKWKYNRNCIVKLKRLGLHFMPDMSKQLLRM